MNNRLRHSLLWLTMSLLLIETIQTKAQTPVLVKNIFPGTGQSISFDNLTDRANAVMNGILYFAADNSTQGMELWRSDGTEAGTYLVKDIRPGSRTASSEPQDFFVHKGILYFLANDGINGYELWKSDGTEAGTTLLKDMRPGASSSNISHYAVVNDEVQFWNSNTYELWKTNGTTTGTVKLANLQTVGRGISARLSTSAVVVNGVWYFEASDDKGIELWRCDGTQAGMRIVKDINPFGDSRPIELTAVNDVLYFAADDGVYGRELWKSDGTEAGTVLVKDVTLGGRGTDMTLIASSNILYFQKYVEDRGFTISELWKSDGTASGTVLVHNPKKSFLYGLTQTATIGNTFFYSFDEDLYRTDITKGGVQQISYPPLSEPGNPTNRHTARLNFSFGLFINIDEQLHFLTQDKGVIADYVYQINKVSDADTVAQAVSYPSGLRLFSLLNRNNRTFFFLANTPQAGYELHRVDVCAHTAKINAPSGASFCPGSSVNIVAEGSGTPGGYTYSWKQGTTNAGTNATLAVNKAGTYTVDVADSKGCLVSTSIEVKQATNLPVTISGATTICAGQSTPLSVSASGGSGTYTYQWRLNGGTLAGATTGIFTATAGGAYSVSVVDASGCTGTSASLNLTQKPLPNATISPAGTTAILSNTAVVLSTPTATGQAYQWFRDGQAIAGATNNTYQANQQGTYTVTVVRDGCSATSAATVVSVVLANDPLYTGFGILVSPNPSDGAVLIEVNNRVGKAITLRVVSASGQLVQSWSLPTSVRRQTLTANLPAAGMYIVQADNGEGRITQKLIRK